MPPPSPRSGTPGSGRPPPRSLKTPQEAWCFPFGFSWRRSKGQAPGPPPGPGTQRSRDRGGKTPRARCGSRSHGPRRPGSRGSSPAPPRRHRCQSFPPRGPWPPGPPCRSSAPCLPWGGTPPPPPGRPGAEGPPPPPPPRTPGGWPPACPTPHRCAPSTTSQIGRQAILVPGKDAGHHLAAPHPAGQLPLKPANGQKVLRGPGILHRVGG